MKNNILNELSKIHPTQITIPASVFLSIRARMERKAGISNPIGSAFSGNKGVILVGKAGTGKTRSLKKIYDGLRLHQRSRNGQPVGKWLGSTGGSTGVGIYEVLETYNDSVIFADELSLDTDKHVHVLKQVAHGELVRPRNKNIEPVPFNGLLIGATNAIRLPSGTKMEHLLATLDRFNVIRVNPSQKSQNDIFDTVFDLQNDEEPDWQIIAQALTRKVYYDMTDHEKDYFRHFWNEKSREILDPTRRAGQYRNVHSLRDIVLFVKRFFDVENLLDNPSVLSFAEKMANDCILFNPVAVLDLSSIEQTIYETVRQPEGATLSDILTAINQTGIALTRNKISKTIANMLENHLITLTYDQKYSTKIDYPDVSSNSMSNLIESL